MNNKYEFINMVEKKEEKEVLFTLKEVETDKEITLKVSTASRPNSCKYPIFLQKDEMYMELNDIDMEKEEKQEMFYHVCKNMGIALKGMKEEYITEEIAMAAIENYPYALQFVPVILRNEAMWNKAVEKAGSTIKYVPKEKRTKELSEIAVHNCPRAIQYVPKEYQSRELSEFAVKNDIASIKYISRDYAYSLYKSEIAEKDVYISDYEKRAWKIYPLEQKYKEEKNQNIRIDNSTNMETIENITDSEVLVKMIEEQVECIKQANMEEKFLQDTLQKVVAKRQAAFQKIYQITAGAIHTKK